MNIYQRMKFARIISGQTQAEIAAKLKIDASAITRYEGSREPGPYIIENVAAATGVPPVWVHEGKYFKGLVVGRLEMPGQEYSIRKCKAIEKVLAETFPAFLVENPPKAVIKLTPPRITNETPAIFVIDNENYCLVLFTNRSSSISHSIISGRHIPIENREIEVYTYLDAYLQPQAQYLKRVLEHAPGSNARWFNELVSVCAYEWNSEPIYQGMSFKFDLPPGVCGPQKGWVDFIIAYLTSVGCSNIEYKPYNEVRPEPSYPSWAPKDYKMKWIGQFD